MRTKSKLLFVVATTIHLLTPAVRATVIYWDGGTTNITTNGDAQSQGGTGTWDGSIKNWDLGSGKGHATWNKRYTASFGGTAGTVTARVNLTVEGMIFNSDGYLITGNNALALKSAGITANANTTINVPLTLGIAQSWTTASGKLLTVGGTVATGSNLLTIGGAGNTMLSGVLSGTGGLTKAGSGLLTLSGANTCTGTTTLSGGFLNLGVAEISGSSGPLGKAGSILFTGGTLQYSTLNATDYSSRFSSAGNQAWNIDTNGRDVTYASALAGASSLTKTGQGILTFSTASSFTGGTTINAGTLNVTGSLADTGTVTVNGGTYTVGAADTVGAVTLTSGTINGNFALTGSSYTVQNGTVTTALAGVGALTKSSAGTVTLSGASSYTGGTTVSAGILNVTGTLADTGGLTVSGGTYTVGANDTIGALTLNNGVINGTATLTAASYAVASGSISVPLAGAGVGLTKSTTDVVTLSGANSYTGATAVNAGTLAVDGSLNALSAVSLASGATLSGMGTVGGAVTVANSSTSVISAGNGTSGSLTVGSLNFLGAGTIQIGTLANYTSTAALRVTGSLSLNGGAGAVSLALPAGVVSEGTYHLINNPLTNLTGFNITGTSLGVRQTSQLVSSLGNIDYVVSGANPYWTGALGSEWSIATLAPLKNWALSASLSTDYISNDAVLFDDRATSTTVSIATNVSPNVVSFNNSTKNYVLQGTAGIATGSLTKSGGGTLTITNANGYSGGTTLYSGVLLIGNNSALGTGIVTLDSGTISSNSTIARSLSNAIALFGNLVVGDSINSGAMTFSGPVDLGGVSRQLTIPSAVTLSGIIQNGGLVKSGAGTLTLSGTNTYSGGTIVNAGTLAIHSSASLGNSSGSVTFVGNSSLLFNSSFAVSRGYAVNTGVTATIHSNGFDLTQNGVISGGGALNKTGAGTFTLAGTNTYAGTTTINGGTLAVAGGAAINDNGSVLLANTAGVVLQLNANETIGNLSGGGVAGGQVSLQASTLTVANTADITYAGSITGSGNLTKSCSGTLTLSGVSTFSGVTTINSGTLNLSADNGLGASPVSPTSGKLVLNGGTLATTATFTLQGNRGITTGGIIDVAVDTILSYGGIAAGTGSLTKSGVGTLVLSGANSYTGATIITTGNLAVNGSLNAGSAVSVAGDAILSGAGTVHGAVTAADNAIIRAGDGISGALGIGGGLTFSGDGIIQIGTLANYSSTATGTAALNLSGALGTTAGASIIFSLPATLLSNGIYHLVSHSNNLTSSFGVFSVSGPTVGDRQAAILTNNSGMLDYVVTGDTPSWTGSAGAAWNTDSSNLNWKLITSGTATYFQANDAVLFDDSATTTTVDIAADVTPAVTRFTNATKAYVIQGTAGITTGALTKTGAGTLTINNANSYSDGTTITAGVLQIGNNGALGTGWVALNGGTLSSNSSTARTLSNSFTIGGNVTLGSATQNGALTLSGSVDLAGTDRQITTASNVTLSGSIGNGGLTKAGSGKMTLSGVSSYAGATSVTGGSLVVNGSLANATMTVATGATLSGSGTVGGATTIPSGGIHAAGNGIGCQNFTHLTYNDGSIFSWEIDRTQTQARGTGYDAVNVSGTLAGLDGIDLNTTTDAIFRIVISDSNFSNSFWNSPRSWSDIFTGSDGLTAKTNWAAIFGGGIQFYNASGAISAPPVGSFTLTGNTLQWSVVPEPSSALAGLLISTGLLRRQRRLQRV